MFLFGCIHLCSVYIDNENAKLKKDLKIEKRAH